MRCHRAEHVSGRRQAVETDDGTVEFVTNRLRAGTGKDKDSLGTVVGRLTGFLLPLLEALVQSQSFKIKWPLGGPWGLEAAGL